MGERDEKREKEREEKGEGERDPPVLPPRRISIIFTMRDNLIGLRHLSFDNY